MENIMDFIKPELLALVPALYIMGAFLKRAAWFADKYIPAMLGVIGVVLALLWVAGTTDLSTVQSILLAVFTTIVQGFICAGGAVYCNQIVKQTTKEDEHDG